MVEEKKGRTLKELYEGAIRRYEKEEKMRSDELCKLEEDMNAARKFCENKNKEKLKHLEDMYNEARSALEDVRRNIVLYSEKISKLREEQC
eukprot:jgi/Antlo1/1143/845